MGHALVTGASGFIGKALVEGLAADGWSIVSAGRRASDGCTVVQHIEWSLGRKLDAHLDGIDVVYHCASAAIAAKANVEDAMRLDVTGTRLLIEQCRCASKSRAAPLLFVFLSSQSSSPRARNVYGRSKYAIEQMMTEPNEVIVRPGLVYDAAGTGVYGTAIRLLRLARIIPKFATTPCIQPIHVEDLVTCLIRVGELGPCGPLCLGNETPLDFVAFCRRAAARERLPVPMFPPWSGAPTQFLLALAARAGVLTNLNERVAGLVALEPMETTPSLAELGVRLRDF